MPVKYSPLWGGPCPVSPCPDSLDPMYSAEPLTGQDVLDAFQGQPDLLRWVAGVVTLSGLSSRRDFLTPSFHTPHPKVSLATIASDNFKYGRPVLIWHMVRLTTPKDRMDGKGKRGPLSLPRKVGPRRPFRSYRWDPTATPETWDPET